MSVLLSLVIFLGGEGMTDQVFLQLGAAQGLMKNHTSDPTAY